MTNQPTSIADELEKLAELRDKKVITHEQFEAHKKALLNHDEVKKEDKPVEVPPKFQISAKTIIGVGLVIGLISAVNSLFYSGGPLPPPPQPTPAFNAICQTHFADVKSAIPELSSVTYIGGTCNDIVYLNFTKIPSDFEFIIRGNAATFSKLRKANGLETGVEVIGKLNGVQMLDCRAYEGRVSGCK